MHQLWLPAVGGGRLFYDSVADGVNHRLQTLGYIHINSASPFFQVDPQPSGHRFAQCRGDHGDADGVFANVLQPPMKPAGQHVATQIKTIRDEP